MHFGNNYGISVVSGRSAYTDKNGPFEVAILHNDSITYNTELTDDVLGYQTESDIDEIIKKVESFIN